MPTNPGIPMSDYAPSWRTDQHPVAWVDWALSEQLGVSPQAAMRGHPPALSWWMQRSIPRVPTPVQPVPVWLQSRPYDRGAGAYAPKFGTIPVSPIGAGIDATYKLPVIAGPGARYMAAAIWFDVQTVPTGMRFGPTVPLESVNALIATSHVGGSYLTTG